MVGFTICVAERAPHTGGGLTQFGMKSVTIDSTQSPVYADRSSDGLLEGLRLIVISGLANLA
jgi:hypothetical protein